MFSIAMTPAEFASARAAVAASKQVYAHTETGELSGILSTPQVNLQYVYDGGAELGVTVLAKHGLAKFASEDEIKAKLEEVLRTALDASREKTGSE